MLRDVAVIEQGSPVSDDGRGLKQADGRVDRAAARGSPVSDDGRGLKHRRCRRDRSAADGSPVSDDGRGLKHGTNQVKQPWRLVRPSAMTGVD